MRIARYKNKHGITSIGFSKNDGIVDISKISTSIPAGLPALLASWPELSDFISGRLDKTIALPLEGITFLPPVEVSNRIICVGLNYAEHAAEGKWARPEHPVFFTRYYSSFVGHGEDMVRPKLSEKYDYEAELAVVIGRPCRHVTREKALEYVAGYTLCNDGSVRDYQKRTPQWTLGKNFDASGAMGPWIITADELPEGARGLKISSKLNGTVMQNDSTANMIFDVATLVSALSEAITLMSGDVISTGTPAGVGFAREPRVWLKPGDVIEVEIEKIGVLKNNIAAE